MASHPPYRSRAARALVLLHDEHLRRFLDVWEHARASALVLPSTADPAYVSLDTLGRHVLRAARGYITWICDMLQLPDPGIREAPPPAALAHEAAASMEEVLAGWRVALRDVRDDQLERPEYRSRWNTLYSIDAMLEHAVLHPIRHAFQLEELMRGASAAIPGDADDPLGPPVDATPARLPGRVTLEGRWARVTPLDPTAHGDALFDACGGARHARLWTYLAGDGPFLDRASFDEYLTARAASEDRLYFAIVDRQSGLAAGHAAYLRMEPHDRSIEVGAIVFSPRLQRTTAATEAMYLMARHAFEDLGYRRYEWKCDSLNAPSRRAALRLGFTFEGVFRHHMIRKGRSRDSAWFSMIDSEWPFRKAAFERWLDASNFGADGRQRRTLAELRRP
jgi:RimJ/RimL family protein N-acetyltransferase